MVCIGIEAKAGSGRLSPAQKEFQRLCEANGATYIVAHSIEDLQAFDVDFVRAGVQRDICHGSEAVRTG
jgi:hypothetical protein